MKTEAIQKCITAANIARATCTHCMDFLSPEGEAEKELAAIKARLSACSLPLMPQPKLLRRVMPGDHRYGNVRGYTARQMKDYATRAIREANE